MDQPHDVRTMYDVMQRLQESLEEVTTCLHALAHQHQWVPVRQFAPPEYVHLWLLIDYGQVQEVRLGWYEGGSYYLRAENDTRHGVGKHTTHWQIVLKPVPPAEAKRGDT